MPDNTPIPPHMLSLRDYAAAAQGVLPEPVRAWLEGTSGHGAARRREEASFARYAIMPRLLADLAGGTTATRLLGQTLAHPVLLAPVGYQTLVHREGEVATAAGALDTVMAVSTMASRRVEDIAAAAAGPLWFQLYMQPARADTLALVRRAEAAGCRALLVTLDTPVQPAPIAALKAGFAMPPAIAPVHLAGFAAPEPVQGAWYNPALAPLCAAAPRMADLQWLRDQTSLPLIAKGVAHPDDAARLMALGWQGVALSTHGGRALDEATAPLALLPAMRKALGPHAAILLDGGVRSGGDVFKALALGANAVMIGRPQIHALAVAGSLGVAHMLKLLREELELTMVLAGTARIADITAAALVPSGECPC